MQKKNNRFVPNNYEVKKENIPIVINEIKNNINLITNTLNKYYPPNSQYKIDSKSKKKVDFSIYTGTGGNMYLYWRKYIYDNKSNESLLQFEKAYTTNLHIFNQLVIEYPDSFSDCNSFFMSQAGIFTMGCILYTIKNDKNAFNESLKNLLSLLNVSLNEESEDELLYGSAGYLYSLLLVKTESNLISNSIEIDQAIVAVALALIDHGLSSKEKLEGLCLLFPFPKTKKKYSLYLGAAHGIIGVLYEILCAVKLFKDKFNSETLNTIKSSIDYIATLQFPTGNFPSSVDGDKDDKVHFCHGPIGAIHLFALSAEIFNEQMYLVPMEKCAQSIWERGLLLKGNCICHGISGSVYGMYKLYQVTKKEEYLIKAMMLAKGTYDPYVQNKVIVTADPQRKVVGIPDTPYSLMEGMGGTLVMYYDLIGGNMRFPGYEIY